MPTKVGKQFVEYIANKDGSRSSSSPVIIHGLSAGPQQAHLRALGLTSIALPGEGNKNPYLIPSPNKSSYQEHPNTAGISSRLFLPMARNLVTIGRLSQEAAQDVPELRDYVKNNASWYHTAHSVATDIGRRLGHGEDAHEVGAGVLAALSGNGTDWERDNVPAAHHVVSAVINGSLDVSNPAKSAATFKLPHGVESQRVENALKIIGGMHYTEVLNPSKEGNFADNIAYPNGDSPHKDTARATIDKQMYDAMTAWKSPWTHPQAAKDMGIAEQNAGIAAQGRNNALNAVVHAASKRLRSDIPEFSSPISTQSGVWVPWKHLSGAAGRQSPEAALFQNYLKKRFPDYGRLQAFNGALRPQVGGELDTQVYPHKDSRAVLSTPAARRAGVV